MEDDNLEPNEDLQMKQKLLQLNNMLKGEYWKVNIKNVIIAPTFFPVTNDIFKIDVIK